MHGEVIQSESYLLSLSITPPTPPQHGHAVIKRAPPFLPRVGQVCARSLSLSLSLFLFLSFSLSSVALPKYQFRRRQLNFNFTAKHFFHHAIPTSRCGNYQ